MRNILILFVLLSVATSVKAEQWNQKTTETQTKTQKYQSGTEQRPLFVKVIPTQKSTEEGKAEKEERDKKILNDNLLTWSTVILAGVTTILAIFTAFLWSATRKLVIGAERTAGQQLRAYVFTKHDDSLREDSKGCITASIIIKNFGQTPAHSMVSDLEIGLCEFPLQSKLELTPKTTQPSKSTLAPGEQVQQFTVLSDVLNPAENLAISEERAAIFVYGEVRYIDAFKIPHTTRICLYSTGEAFANGMLAYYHEGNDAD